MPGIVDFFLEFMINHEQQPDFSNIDVSLLINQSEMYTPLMLKYSNPDESFKDMPAVIVNNFCKYLQLKKYPKYGLKAIINIITKDANDTNVKAQLILLVHFTKLNLPIPLSALYYKEFEKLIVITELTTQLKIWKNLALKVLAHNNVNVIINTLINDTFGNDFISKVLETEHIPVSVNIVKANENELRGFAGINEIFINQDHFMMRMSEWTYGDIDLLAQFIKMDIVSVAIHEYSHVRIRQCLDDLNMSTPNVIINNVETDVEFGRIAEKAFFGGAVQWVKSRECISPSYLKEFLDAIENNTELPKLTEEDKLIYRTPYVSMCSGLDICQRHSCLIE